MKTFNEILKDPTIKAIYNQSQANMIPMIREKTALFLLDIIEKYHIKTCLEIGTAMGFSASIMGIEAKIDVTTIEKDASRNMSANYHLKSFKNINCVHRDCFDYETSKKFDLIFIDGPKSNQIDLFKKLSNYLSDQGIILIDNIYLNKLRKLEIKTSNQQKLLNAVDEFRNYLENLETFKVTIIDIDDGLALVEKK